MVTRSLKNALKPQWFPNPKFPEHLRAPQPKIEQRMVVSGQDAGLEPLENFMPNALSDIRTVINNLSRPRLLIRAARFGLTEYRRDRDLRRLIGAAASPEASLTRLITVEDEMETTRRLGDASYSIARHIEVLIALMAEARVVLHKPTVV
jgi:hypothetical protein